MRTARGRSTRRRRELVMPQSSRRGTRVLLPASRSPARRRLPRRSSMPRLPPRAFYIFRTQRTPVPEPPKSPKKIDSPNMPTVFPRISRGAHMSTAKELAAKVKHTNSTSLTAQKAQLRDTQASLAKTKAQTRIPTHRLSRSDQFTERVTCHVIWLEFLLFSDPYDPLT